MFWNGEGGMGLGAGEHVPGVHWSQRDQSLHSLVEIVRVGFEEQRIGECLGDQGHRRIQHLIALQGVGNNEGLESGGEYRGYEQVKYVLP
jgi:hypothetical protein